jgi:hypothetical protein
MALDRRLFVEMGASEGRDAVNRTNRNALIGHQRVVNDDPIPAAHGVRFVECWDNQDNLYRKTIKRILTSAFQPRSLGLHMKRVT